MYAIEFNAAEERWRLEARCRDGAASLTELFFSEDIGDISRAKSFCAGCVVPRAVPRGRGRPPGAVGRLGR